MSQQYLWLMYPIQWGLLRKDVDCCWGGRRRAMLAPIICVNTLPRGKGAGYVGSDDLSVRWCEEASHISGKPGEKQDITSSPGSEHGALHKVVFTRDILANQLPAAVSRYLVLSIMTPTW